MHKPYGCESLEFSLSKVPLKLASGVLRTFRADLKVVIHS